MRDPALLKQVEYNGESLTTIKLDDVPEFDIEDYDLLDPKELSQYIDNLEKICRGSYEYRKLISFLRDNLNMNQCAFYENVNNIDSYKIKIELHHHPFTLRDICVIVFNKRKALMEILDDEIVAKEVMYIHYCLLIGLIPLSETVHELVHNNYLFIPNDKVMGRYQDFYNMYEEYMTPEMIDIYERTMEFSNVYCEDMQKHILAKSFIYVDISGAYDLPTYQEVVDSMNRRIKQIKEGKPEKIKVTTVDKGK